MIELRRITRTYRQHDRQIHALHDICMTVDRGQIMGILGESGAGKSTLLRTVNLLEQPNSGQVFIDGKELTSLSIAQLREQRHNIGMIFQHFNLLNSRTVFENIALPLELIGMPTKELHARVNELLELVNLTDRANHYPHQLSGGQKQRAAIGRALATKPAILLCDEATSALDPKSKFAILSLLKKINHDLGVTIMLITHEMDVIKHTCTHAGVLHQGELVEQGTVIDLFARPTSEVTRQLVHKSLYIELPPSIKSELQTQQDVNKSRLVRFTFVGDESGQPLIASLTRKFNLGVNILQANIETIQDATIGFTVCQLIGDHQAINDALASIPPSSITVEVLGYV